MKISICIPVYNFAITPLVKDLNQQIKKDQIEAEIVIIDDASDDFYIQLNKAAIPFISQYILLPENIGRSKIRNRFLDFAKADYLFFLDCDGKIDNSHFLKNYIDYIDKHQPEIIYGGRIVDEEEPDAKYHLRWEFATRRENLPCEVRLKHPYSSFQTNNFVILKSLLREVRFNEDITQYGYEDLVFAMNLRKKKINIHHIDNPIVNNDIETNEVFLHKSDLSAKSLSQLLKKSRNIDQVAEIKLANAYLFIEKIKCIFLFRVVYKLSKKIITKRLIKGKGSLRELDFYKLGQLIYYMRTS